MEQERRNQADPEKAFADHRVEENNRHKPGGGNSSGSAGGETPSPQKIINYDELEVFDASIFDEAPPQPKPSAVALEGGKQQAAVDGGELLRGAGRRGEEGRRKAGQTETETPSKKLPAQEPGESWSGDLDSIIVDSKQKKEEPHPVAASHPVIHSDSPPPDFLEGALSAVGHVGADQEEELPQSPDDLWWLAPDEREVEFLKQRYGIDYEPPMSQLNYPEEPARHPCGSQPTAPADTTPSEAPAKHNGASAIIAPPPAQDYPTAEPEGATCGLASELPAGTHVEHMPTADQGLPTEGTSGPAAAPQGQDYEVYQWDADAYGPDETSQLPEDWLRPQEPESQRGPDADGKVQAHEDQGGDEAPVMPENASGEGDAAGLAVEPVAVVPPLELPAAAAEEGFILPRPTFSEPSEDELRKIHESHPRVSAAFTFINSDLLSMSPTTQTRISPENKPVVHYYPGSLTMSRLLPRIVEIEDYAKKRKKELLPALAMDPHSKEALILQSIDKQNVREILGAPTFSGALRQPAIAPTISSGNEYVDSAVRQGRWGDAFLFASEQAIREKVVDSYASSMAGRHCTEYFYLLVISGNDHVARKEFLSLGNKEELLSDWFIIAQGIACHRAESFSEAFISALLERKMTGPAIALLFLSRAMGPISAVNIIKESPDFFFDFLRALLVYSAYFNEQVSVTEHKLRYIAYLNDLKHERAEEFYNLTKDEYTREDKAMIEEKIGAKPAGWRLSGLMNVVDKGLTKIIGVESTATSSLDITAVPSPSSEAPASPFPPRSVPATPLPIAVPTAAHGAPEAAIVTDQTRMSPPAGEASIPLPAPAVPAPPSEPVPPIKAPSADARELSHSTSPASTISDESNYLDPSRYEPIPASLPERKGWIASLPGLGPVGRFFRKLTGAEIPVVKLAEDTTFVFDKVKGQWITMRASTMTPVENTLTVREQVSVLGHAGAAAPPVLEPPKLEGPPRPDAQAASSAPSNSLESRYGKPRTAVIEPAGEPIAIPMPAGFGASSSASANKKE